MIKIFISDFLLISCESYPSHIRLNGNATTESISKPYTMFFYKYQILKIDKSMQKGLSLIHI